MTATSQLKSVPLDDLDKEIGETSQAMELARVSDAMVHQGEVVPPVLAGDTRWNDIANAERFLYAFGDNLRYCVESGKWMIYHDGHWQVDGKFSISQLAREFCKEELEAAIAAGNITLTPCSGGTVTTNGVKVYRATLTQTGTSAPVATVLENSTGTTLTWGYTSAGFYTVTAGSAIFTANKVAVYGTTSAAAAVFTIGTSRTSTSVVTVKTWDASGNQVFADGGLTENAFTIFIYP